MQQDFKARKEPENWDANIHYKDAGVAAFYDAVRFSSLAGKVFNAREKRIIKHAVASFIPEGSTVADIPCGTGRLAETLLELGYRVHGIDISAEMLDVARERLRRFRDAFTAEVADAKKLDRSQAQFGGVLCARVLMHFKLPEQIEFLRGVAQLTAGIVIINHSFSSPYQKFRRWVKQLLGHAAPARYPVTSLELAELMNKAGLEELRRYRLNSLISEAIYIIARPSRNQPKP